MPTRRYTINVDERGRFVLPADVRSCLAVDRGGLIVLNVEFDHQTVQLHKAADVARSGRGLLRDVAPDTDLAGDLVRDRRDEAERETADELARA